MKAIFVVLVLSCATFAMAEERSKREINMEAIKNSCPGKCLGQGYQVIIAQMTTNTSKFRQGSKPADIVPNLQPEQLESGCVEVSQMQTCMNQCNDPADAELKGKCLAVMTSIKDVNCDAAIKANIACLTGWDNNPQKLPAGCEHCKPLAQPAMDLLPQLVKPDWKYDWEKIELFGKSGCKFINCGLKCGKTGIEQKCQAAGYNALKSLYKKSAVAAKAIHGHFRPAQKFPDECKPENIVAGA